MGLDATSRLQAFSLLIFAVQYNQAGAHVIPVPVPVRALLAAAVVLGTRHARHGAAGLCRCGRKHVYNMLISRDVLGGALCACTVVRAAVN
jgi:hypothetical protein